jgi:hypothetical protein
MECGSLLPLLDWERFAESKAAASLRTPKSLALHAAQTPAAYATQNPLSSDSSAQAPAKAQALAKTGPPEIFTWFHLISPGFTWFHLFSLPDPRGGPAMPPTTFLLKTVKFSSAIPSAIGLATAEASATADAPLRGNSRIPPILHFFASFPEPGLLKIWTRKVLGKDE